MGWWISCIYCHRRRRRPTTPLTSLSSVQMAFSVPFLSEFDVFCFVFCFERRFKSKLSMYMCEIYMQIIGHYKIGEHCDFGVKRGFCYACVHTLFHLRNAPQHQCIRTLTAPALPISTRALLNRIFHPFIKLVIIITTLWFLVHWKNTWILNFLSIVCKIFRT